MESISLRPKTNSCFLTQSIYAFLCCKPFINFIKNQPELLRPTKTSMITKKYIDLFLSNNDISNFSIELYDELVPKINNSFLDNRESTQKPAGDFIDIWLDQLGPSVKQLFYYKSTYLSICPCGKRLDGKINKNIWRMIILDQREFVDQVCLSIDNIEIKCSRCDQNRSLKRFERLTYAPDIFIFYFNPTILRNPLPESFIIPNRTNPVLSYDLTCVILHFGNNNGGHFITQSVLGGKKYNMEGTNVREISEIERQRNINFAFYCKR